MSRSVKCLCGHKNKNGTCPNCSRIKMTILLKNGCDFLRNSNSQGKPVNPVWYSYLKHNRLSTDSIILGMLRRFTKSHYCQYTQVIQFREDGVLVAEFKP